MTIQSTRIGNGLTVATHAMPHLESVALGVWVGAGARSEEVQEHGMSHLLEHMAFKGTERRSAREIAEAVEAAGGEINAETSVDHTAFYVRLMKEDVALGLDVLGDILCNSLFQEDELEREQHVILQEIGAVLDTPEDFVFDMFQEAAYPGQAIGRSILGTPDSVAGFGAEDIRRFLATHYRGTQMVLAAVGNLDHDSIVAQAEKSLGALPAEDAPSLDPGRYRGGAWREMKPLQEAQLLIGFEGPSFADPDFHAAHLLSSILGGGMASRLFQEARENRGLCYSTYSFYWPYVDTGLFGVEAATSQEDLGELVEVVLDEVVKMTDGVTDAELRRAKAQTRSGLLMALENPLARAGQMARHQLIHGRLLKLEEIVANIEAVGAADVARLARRMLSSPPTVAAIGPIDALPDEAAIAGRIAGSSVRLN